MIPAQPDQFGNIAAPPAVAAAPSSQSTTREYRFPQLDALRAFAVIAVVATHTAGPLVNTGTVGVLLFFVISGFLITGILLDARSRAEASGEPRSRVLRVFYARRALRIFPVYYVTLAVGAAIGIPTMRENLGWNLLYLSNWRIALDRDWGIVPHIWSLAVEEQFYLFWPLIILFAPRKALPWAIGAMIVVAPTTRAWIAGLTDMWVDAAAIVTPGTFDSLGLGALLALLWRSSRDVDRIVAWLGAISLALFAARFAERWVDFLPISGQIQMIRWPLLFVWLLHRAARGFKGPVGRALQWRPLIYIGTVSYGIYLFHLLVLPTAQILQDRIGVNLHLPPRGLAQFLLVSAVTVALAGLSWRFLEQPINRQKRRFPYVRALATVREAPPDGEGPGSPARREAHTVGSGNEDAVEHRVEAATEAVSERRSIGALVKTAATSAVFVGTVLACRRRRSSRTQPTD